MGQFVDEDDVRRPSEFPRVSERHRIKFETIWYPPTRSLFGTRPKGVEVQVLDPSVAGALLVAPTNPRLVPGVKIKMLFEDVTAVIVVRNVRPSSTPQHSYYGIAFFGMGRELELKVLQLVAELQMS
jgi:hypothetical protein